MFFLRFQFLRDKILFAFILEVFEKQSRFPLVVEKKRIPETCYDAKVKIWAKEMKLLQKYFEENSIQS